MAFIDMESYSNKQLAFFVVVCGIIAGALLFLIGTKPILLLFIMSIILCFTYIRNVWLWFILFLGSLPFNSLLAIDIGAPFRLSYLLFLPVLCSLIYNISLDLKSGEQTKSEIIERFKTPFDKEIVLVLLVIVLSIFQSQYILANSPVTGDSVFNYPWIKSITKFLLLGYLISVFYVTIFIFNSKEKLKRVLFWNGGFVLLYSVYGLISYLFFISGYHIGLFNFDSIIQHNPPTDVPRIRAVAEEPLFFGFYIITVIFILISICISHLLKWHKESNFVKLFVQIILITAALLLSFSRSAWIGFFFGAAFLFIFYLERRGKSFLISALNKLYHSIFYATARKKNIMLIVLALAGIIIYYIFSQYVVTSVFFEKAIDSFNPVGDKLWSTKTRLITYDQAVDAFLAHPFLGVGYENFNFHSGNKFYPGLVDFNFNWTEVNNYPLKILAELGIIGFIVGAFFYAKILVLGAKSIKAASDPFLQAVLVGSFATLIAVSAILLFSSSIIMPYLWIFAGIFVAAMKISEVKKRQA